MEKDSLIVAFHAWARAGGISNARQSQLATICDPPMTRFAGLPLGSKPMPRTKEVLRLKAAEPHRFSTPLQAKGAFAMAFHPSVHSGVSFRRNFSDVFEHEYVTSTARAELHKTLLPRRLLSKPRGNEVGDDVPMVQRPLRCPPPPLLVR